MKENNIQSRKDILNKIDNFVEIIQRKYYIMRIKQKLKKRANYLPSRTNYYNNLLLKMWYRSYTEKLWEKKKKFKLIEEIKEKDLKKDDDKWLNKVPMDFQSNSLGELKELLDGLKHMEYHYLLDY